MSFDDNEIVTALDTTVGEDGNDQVCKFGALAEDQPFRFSASIASGDTVIAQGRPTSSDAWETLYVFADNTPVDIYLSHLWRVVRTNDGAVGDSTVKVENKFGLKWSDHTA